MVITHLFNDRTLRNVPDLCALLPEHHIGISIADQIRHWQGSIS